MGIFSNLKQRFPGLAKAEAISILETSTFQTLGLNRSSTRIRYNSESAFTAYRCHELVFACINKIADVMNDAEICVEIKNAKGEWEKKDGHMLTALFKRPNSYQTGRDVRRLMVQSEQALGRFYAHVDRSAAGIPVAMTVLNPNRIQPLYNHAKNEIIAYEYTNNLGMPIKINPQDLLIRRRPDLMDQFNGFAPLDAALKSINSDLGFTDYVDAFFESDGTPSGILKILNQSVPDAKREALQAAWRKKYSRGGSNQKGVAVLDQNADFQKIGSNIDELESDSLSGRFESRICSVFGVPPNLVGAYVGLLHVTANATAKAELQNFWDNKISGELAIMREWLTWFVLPQFEDIDAIRAEKIRVGYDISHVAFLQEDVEALHKRARENFRAGGWTLNEFRQATGLMPDPKGDYYLQPATLAALSPENRASEAFQKVEVGTDPKEPKKPDEPAIADEEDGSGDPDDLEKAALWGKESQTGVLGLAEAGDGFAQKKTFDLDGLILGREPKGVELVIDLKKIASDYESEREKIQKILQKFRIELISQAVSKLDKLTSETAHTLTLTPDPKRRKEIAKALLSAYKNGRLQIVNEIALQNAAKNRNWAENKADENDYEDFLEYLDELTDGLISRIINEVTTRAVNQYLQLKLLMDYTVEKLSDLLLDQSEKYIDQMAGSSVNAAMSAGRDDELEAQADSLEYVEYSAILDQNTCGPCGDADGMTADKAEDLPSVPNPDCDGGDRCRCIHVGVIV